MTFLRLVMLCTASMIFLVSCDHQGRLDLSKVVIPTLQTAQSSSTRYQSGDSVQIDRTVVPGCEGIEIVTANLMMYQGQVPYWGVELANNNTDGRRGVTLEVELTYETRSVLVQSDAESWADFGPFVLRAKDRGTFGLTTPNENAATRRKVKSIKFARCTR